MTFFDKINSIAKNVGDKTGDAIEMAKINARIASERSAMNDIYTASTSDPFSGGIEE